MRQIGEARVQKPKNIGNLRPEGRLDPILGEGLAECAGPAEALELVKIVDGSPPERGRRTQSLRALRRAYTRM